MNKDGADAPRDILSNRFLTGIVFLLPVLAIIVSGSLDIGQAWRTAVWTTALGIMGIACLANALRCGRVHCYATGPFFLIMAIVTVLYGLGVVPLGTHGWSTLSLAILAGALLFCCLPEVLFGKYRPRPGRAPDS